jgi:ribokinase
MTFTVPRIAVVGSLHYDILVMGDDRPRRGETLIGDSWAWKCGGKGGNQAIEAARHGAAVAFVGAVGKDGFGDALLAKLMSARVDTSGIRRLADIGSGMSVAIFDRTGDYGAVIVPGSNWRITAGDLRASPSLSDCDILLLQNEVSPEINLAAASIAKSGGATVILNAAPVRDLPDDLAGLLDVLVVNEIEAEGLAGIGRVIGFERAEAAAEALLARVGRVVVTLGRLGLVAAERTLPPVRLPAHSVAVASTHGAGDALIGAMAARLADGATLTEAARYANAAAAVLVSTAEAERILLTAAATQALLDG